MIKITNINFKYKSIQNIEINDETINNLEITFTTNKFKIIFIKDNEKKTYKEINKSNNEDIINNIEIQEQETQEEAQEFNKTNNEDIIKNIETQEQKQETQEDIQEEEQETQEEIQEEAQEFNQTITLQKMKELLQELKDNELKNNYRTLSQNTINSYYRPIKAIYHHFKILDMNELFKTKEKEITDYIVEEYKNYSTIKSKLCGIKKCYEILNIDCVYLKSKIEEYINKTNYTF